MFNYSEVHPFRVHCCTLFFFWEFIGSSYSTRDPVWWKRWPSTTQWQPRFPLCVFMHGQFVWLGYSGAGPASGFDCACNSLKSCGVKPTKDESSLSASFWMIKYIIRHNNSTARTDPLPYHGNKIMEVLVSTVCVHRIITSCYSIHGQ